MKKNLYIGNSGITGKGIFTKKDLPGGTVAFITKGRLINFKVKNSFDSQIGPNWLGIGKDVWLEPNEDDLLTYLNHSCQPNLGIKGKVTFVALRDIKSNEEITFDYSTAEGDKLWKLPFRCRCGSKRCRKEIRSVHYLPKIIFEEYRNFIPKYFRLLYNRRYSEK